MNSDGFSPTPDAPVLVIGAAGIDIVGRLRSELNNAGSSPAHIRTSFGGVARNVAENLARLGHPVTLLSAVGVDHAGEQLLEQAAAAGVDVEHVLRNPDYPTGTYIGVLSAHGAVKLAIDDMRAIAAITPQFLKEKVDLFKQASVIFLDANLSKESLRTAFSLARRTNRPVCADPTAPGLARRLRPYLGRVRLISPNEVEASVLTERTVDPGSMAAPGVPLLTLEDAHALRLEVRLGEARAALGEPLEVLPRVAVEVVVVVGVERVRLVLGEQLRDRRRRLRAAPATAVEAVEAGGNGPGQCEEPQAQSEKDSVHCS